MFDQSSFQISVGELDQARRDGVDLVVLDVREPFEVAFCALENSMTIPMASVPQHLDQLPKDKPVVVMCHHGVRSAHVTSYLRDQGFDNAINLEGGIDAWSRRVDATVPLY